jgi:hypothetical protein
LRNSQRASIQTADEEVLIVTEEEEEEEEEACDRSMLAFAEIRNELRSPDPWFPGSLLAGVQWAANRASKPFSLPVCYDSSSLLSSSSSGGG